MFHEYGHYLDDVLGDGNANGMGYSSEQYDLSSTIRDEVKADIKNNLVNLCDDLNIPLSDEEIDEIVNTIVSPNTGNDDTSGWTDDMKDAYNKLLMAYNFVLSPYRVPTWVPGESVSESLEGVTDVYTGVTDMRINWGYGHRDYTPSYWYPDGTMSSNVGKEFFAESFSHNFTRSPRNQVVNTQNVLGESYDTYEQMVADAST